MSLTPDQIREFLTQAEARHAAHRSLLPAPTPEQSGHAEDLFAAAVIRDGARSSVLIAPSGGAGWMGGTEWVGGDKWELKPLQELVGGLIQIVPVMADLAQAEDWVLVVNEEGLCLGLDYNPRASHLAQQHIVGPVVLTKSASID